MSISFRDHKNHKIIVLDGDFSVYNFKELRSIITDATNGDHKSVVVDVEHVTSIDSSVIDLLLNGQKRMNENKGGFFLLNPPNKVTDVLNLIGIDFKTIESDAL